MLDYKETTPLKWPDGWGRTLIDQRKTRANWKKPFSFYRDSMLKELERIGVTAVTISRMDSGREKQDPGVAVWFSLKAQQDFSWQRGLGLDNPLPTLEEIDTAFRKIAAKHHPDVVAANPSGGGDVQIYLRADAHRKQAKSYVLGQAAPVLDNCIPCDRFTDARQNLAAVNLALRCFRSLERVGIPAILERVMGQAFKTALPEKATNVQPVA